MSVINYKDQHVLENLYWGNGLSCYLIAEKFAVSEHTIRYWMSKCKIPKRDMSSAVKTVYAMGYRTHSNKGIHLSKEQKKAVSDGLKKAYETGRRKSWNKGKKESKEHREKISEGLKRAYAEGRRPSLKGTYEREPKVQISKEEMEKLYCEEGLPGSQISKKLGVCRQTIDNYRKQLGIPSRSASENSKRFNWIRGLTKETDLRVRNIAEQRRGKPRPDISALQRDPNFIKKKLKGLIKRPTKPEQAVISIITEHHLPFRYTGDGEVIIGTKCPDFTSNNGKNKLIEVFGRVFHDPKESFREEIPWHQQYWGRIAYYAQFGYDCLILWDDELENEQEIVDKIQMFMEG